MVVKSTNYTNRVNKFEFITYMLPPSSLQFIVTIMAPIQTITNTSANSGPPSFAAGDESEPWSTLENKLHKYKFFHCLLVFIIKAEIYINHQNLNTPALMHHTHSAAVTARHYVVREH